MKLKNIALLGIEESWNEKILPWDIEIRSISQKCITPNVESSVLGEEHFFFQEPPAKLLFQRNVSDTLWFLLIQYKLMLRFRRKIYLTQGGDTVVF